MEPENDWTQWFIITASIWCGVAPILWMIRARGSLIAWISGPIVLLSIWGLHLTLAHNWFRQYGGWWYPSTIEVFASAFTWGIIFVIAFSLFTTIETWTYSRSSETMPIPKRRFKAMMWGHLSAAIIANMLGPHRAFAMLTFFDLPLFSILAQLRPGMGSVTFIPHSAMLYYPFVGTLLFACLGWSIGYIETRTGRSDPPIVTSETQEIAQPERQLGAESEIESHWPPPG